MTRGIFRVVWLIGLLWAFGNFVACGSYLIHDIQTGNSNESFLLWDFIKTILFYATFGVGPGIFVAKAANWAMRRLEY